MFNLSPKNDKFFDMFISLSEIQYKAALKLKVFAMDLSNIEVKLREIKSIESEGDDQVHSIFEELNNSFITPIDREDICDISKSMDDIIDYIESAASRFGIFNIKDVKDEAIHLIELIIECCEKIKELMIEFKKMKKQDNLTQIIIDINRIENEGDLIFRAAVRELFDGKTDAIEVISWKEIYQCLENVLDACESVANIVEGVVMKNV